MKVLKISILANIGISFIIACFALYAGFHHNPQEEFINTISGEINYGRSSLLFLFWFIFVMLVGTGITALGWGLCKTTQRIKLAWKK